MMKMSIQTIVYYTFREGERCDQALDWLMPGMKYPPFIRRIIGSVLSLLVSIKTIKPEK